MYSQDSISGHRRGRPEPTAEMLSGLACLICGTDYRNTPDPEAVVVSHRDGKQLLACHGTCARMACGSVNGLAETPLPLTERVRGHRPGAAS
ncbi:MULTISPECIES: hypothetical protein [unclassified Streptomyces]|uniref:hypothetical protein n=1 Tax=unclassified Streptomyces TaxID=2593676 RepID=UPI0033EE3A50